MKMKRDKNYQLAMENEMIAMIAAMGLTLSLTILVSIRAGGAAAGVV